MLYDLRLSIRYDYGRPVAGGRHLLRVIPRPLAGLQQVLAAGLDVSPAASEQGEYRDFYGNVATALSLNFSHPHVTMKMQARVRVERAPTDPDAGADLHGLPEALRARRCLAADSPHHFLGPTRRLPQIPEIADWALRSATHARPVHAIASEICTRVFEDFVYDPDATLVDTPLAEAFALKRGVCQDFAHIMIAALQSQGIPAAYVSGFIRTIPPAGQKRLEGADAMHAWVRVWCGGTLGWVEFDPTNRIEANDDHIVVAYGRDYLEASPVVGILQAGGAHRTDQAVDVVPLGEPG